MASFRPRNKRRMPELSKHSNQPIRVRPPVPEAERKRVAQACQRCRARKNRCIIANGQRAAHRPACQRCLSVGVACVFVAGDTWSDSSPTGPMLQTSQALTGSVSGSALEQGDGERDRTNGARDDASPEDPRLSARLVVKNPHQTHFVGEVSNGTFLAELQNAVIAVTPTEERMDVDSSREPIAVDAKLLETAKQGLPPRGVTDFLVHVFFHTVEANYYYMDRQEFMARLSNWYENPANDNLDPSFLCLLLIVLAMGSQFAELEGSSPRVRTKSVSRNGHGMVFYLKAKSLLSDVVTQCSLESIQACFLMGLFLLPTNISDLSYVYHGMALKMAISAGLHRQIKETNLDQRVMHVRNRLWWSLYTSERRLTIFLDRPQSIHEEDIDTPLPEFSQELDLPQSENNVANLQASISLTRIFNQVVRVGRTVGFGNDIGENTITTIRRTLDDWVERLPQQLKLESLSPDMKSFRGAVHLHMNWNQIVIFMGRKSLLRQFRRCLSRRHDISQAESSPLPALNDEGPITALEARLIQDCVSAAVKIIHLIDYLWKMGKLARFSFTDYNCCSMATLIIMVHEIAVQQPLYPLYLETAMQAMTHMATGCHNAGQALKLIQHLQRVFAGLKNKEPQERRSNHVGDNVSAFREWERWITTREGDGSLPIGTTPVQGTLAMDEDGEPTSWGQPSDHRAPTPGLDVACHTEDGGSVLGRDFHDTVCDAEIHNVLNGIWPDSLDSLGLSGFEDFAFPSLYNGGVSV